MRGSSLQARICVHRDAGACRRPAEDRSLYFISPLNGAVDVVVEVGLCKHLSALQFLHTRPVVPGGARNVCMRIRGAAAQNRTVLVVAMRQEWNVFPKQVIVGFRQVATNDRKVSLVEEKLNIWYFARLRQLLKEICKSRYARVVFCRRVLDANDGIVSDPCRRKLVDLFRIETTVVNLVDVLDKLQMASIARSHLQPTGPFVFKVVFRKRQKHFQLVVDDFDKDAFLELVEDVAECVRHRIRIKIYISIPQQSRIIKSYSCRCYRIFFLFITTEISVVSILFKLLFVSTREMGLRKPSVARIRLRPVVKVICITFFFIQEKVWHHLKMRSRCCSSSCILHVKKENAKLVILKIFALIISQFNFFISLSINKKVKNNI